MDSDSLQLFAKLPGGKEFQFSLPPESPGSRVRDSISELSGIPGAQLKLLFGGKFLNDELTLSAQNIKNNTKFLVLLKKSDEQILMQKKKDEEASRIDRVLKAAEKLASREDEGDSGQFYFELSDQNGNPIQLPTHERKALVMGLSLHDNGRRKLNDGQIPEALDLLLAADKSLSQVNTDVLSSTDNYGILCLDVAWCYFLTQNIEFLTDAAWRLQKAEQCFQKSYGPNQERLIALKGAAAPEMIVFVRLDLLNMVVAYHQGNFTKAKYFFGLAKGRIETMHINEEDTLPLVAMGFDPRECRIALRTCKKNFDAAAQWLMERKEQKEQRRREERQKRNQERKQRRWGRTRNGNWVNLDALKEFVDMGFEEALAAEALKQGDNSRDAALSSLLNQPEVLRIAANQNFNPDSGHLDYLESMGFTREQAAAALKQAAGVLDGAVSALLARLDTPLIPQSTLDTAADPPVAADGAAAAQPAAENTAPPIVQPVVETEEQRRERELAEEAERDVIDSLGDEEAHLDVNLEREVSVLQLYEGLLEGK